MFIPKRRAALPERDALDCSCSKPTYWQWPDIIDKIDRACINYNVWFGLIYAGLSLWLILWGISCD